MALQYKSKTIIRKVSLLKYRFFKERNEFFHGRSEAFIFMTEKLYVQFTVSFGHFPISKWRRYLIPILFFDGD